MKKIITVVVALMGSAAMAQECGVTVAKKDLPDRYNWEKAMKACPEGWRLPTREELECMCDNRTTIGGFTADVSYWSSTKYDSSFAYFVTFVSNGFCGKGYGESNIFRVRCVRDKQ